MIRVTRLDHEELVLNCDLIEALDARPDTTIRLVTGRSHVVRESVSEVLGRIRDWRAAILSSAGLGALAAGAPVPLLSLPSTLELSAEEAEVLA